MNNVPSHVECQQEPREGEQNLVRRSPHGPSILPPVRMSGASLGDSSQGESRDCTGSVCHREGSQGTEALTKITHLHRRWSKDADYKDAYDALGEEFDLARALIETGTAAGLSQSQLVDCPQHPPLDTSLSPSRSCRFKAQSVQPGR
jgi:hypothetical protein